MATASTHDVLGQLFDSLSDCLTPEAARRILDIHLDPRTQAHINDLAVKANEGALTVEEREHYAQFIETIDLLGIFQAKARQVLSRKSS
jgi:hypothetical protein